MRNFSRKAQMAFLEDLLSLVEDGLTLSQAIDILRKTLKHAPQRVAIALAETLKRGQLLADGMRHQFVVPVVELVRSGEKAGTLIRALQSAVKYYQEQQRWWAGVVQALLYPMIVFLFSLGILVMVKDTVLTRFIGIQSRNDWPSFGNQLFEFANLVESEGPWLLLLIMLMGVFSVKLLQNMTGSWRTCLDRWPLLSLYRRMTAARFMEMLGLLLENGVAIKEALRILQQSALPYLSWHLLLMEYRLGSGADNLADVLDTQLMVEEDVLRLRALAKGAKFQQALIRMGQRAHQRNAQTVLMAARVTGGLLLIATTLVAISLVLGIYTISSTMVA